MTHRHSLLPWQKCYNLYAYGRFCRTCSEVVLLAPEETLFRLDRVQRQACGRL